MIFMKKYLLSSFCMMLISSTISLNAQNNVSLEIVHALGEKSFGLNQESQTPEGVKFNVNRLEYYMSEITLVHDGGQETIVEDLWALVRANYNTIVELGALNVTEIEGLRFSIGVDSAHNHLDPSSYSQFHPLANQNPSMHWGWAAGYRFVALEGMGGEQLDQTYEIHALGDDYYFEVELAVSATAENGELNTVIYGDYNQAMTGIDVSSGVITHGEFGEAIVLLENFRDLVFTTTSPIDSTIEEEPNGISELTSSLDFQLFPNPAIDGSTMLTSISSSPLNVVVFDLTGKQVHTEQLNNGSQALSINSLESGVYFVKVKDLNSNEVIVKKLSVQ